MEKDLLKLFEEMHKLKLENEKLNKENSELKAALDKKAEDFFKAEDNCIYSYVSNTIIGSTVRYRIFNPTADVDANIRALLKDGGVEIMRPFHPMDENSVLCVKVDGIKYYSNPYCVEARSSLKILKTEISFLQKEARELAAEVKWLRKGAEENGKPKRSGFLGFRKPYM